MKKLYTHIDKDGIGCAILAKLTYGEDVDIEYCNYDEINEKVKEFILSGEYENYEFIFITDISVNQEVAELIDTNLSYKYIKLLDHHKTAEYLNKYEWATVREFIDVESKDCGTNMFYNYLLNANVMIQKYVVSQFVENVRQYDTWEWKTKYNNDIPKKWNDLLYILGRDRFIDTMIKRINRESIEFTESDTMLLDLEQEKIDKYIESKQKLITETKILGYNAGVVFAERYHSECGNKLSELNPHLDFIVLINPSYSVSYRGIKNDIDLGETVAKVFGGGGHAKAAGSPLPENFTNKVIEMIFKQ